MTNSAEEAKKYTSILGVLLSDMTTVELLHDFADRYYDATHPLELAEMGASASASADIVVTVLLAIFTAGVGAAANVAMKSARLAKVAKLLERLAKVLKRIGPRRKMSKKHVAGSKSTSVKKKPGKTKSGMPEPEKPKARKEIDKTSDKVDGTDGNGKGPKTTAKITGDKGTTVKVDSHKIYDPSHPPQSSNPKAQYRFSDPTYRSTGGDVYFGENVGTAFHEVRKNIHGKSLYVGEVRVDNVLDLSDPNVIKQMNIDPAKLTTKVDDVLAQKKVYGYTNQIANQAYDAGYSGIVYPSSRKA